MSMAQRWLAVVMVLAAVGACKEENPVSYDASPHPDADVSGTFTVAWMLNDGTSALDCADVDALTVSMEYIIVGAISGQRESFNCAAGMGTTRGIQPGTYDLTFHVSTNGGNLEMAPVVLSGQELDANGNVNLGTIDLTVVPQGSFSFSLNAGETGGNCAAVDPDMGAGITQFTLELQDGAGTCVPATFAVAGGDPIVADCVTPAVTAGCVESDVVFTVLDTGSGPHKLVVTGARDTLDCYKTTAQFAVPGGNLARDLGDITVLPDMTVEGCFPEMM